MGSTPLGVDLKGDMMPFPRRTNIRFAALLLSLFFVLGCGSKAESDPMAPGFTLQDLSGQSVSLEQYRGKTILLDFWATWCPPCRMSIPELVKLQKEYGEKGLVVLGISLDDPRQASNRFLEAFKEKNRINYPILRYDERVIRDYFQEETPAIPTMFVIGPEGKIKGKIVGFRPDVLKKTLSNILK